MLNKKRGGQRVGGSHLLQHVGTSGGGLSRRLFLAHSGLAAGGLAGISALDLP